MRRYLFSSLFLLFICMILIMHFFGDMLRAALSPKVEVIHPQIYASDGRHLEHAVPMEAIHVDESGTMFVWLAVEDDSSDEKCYITKKEIVQPGNILDTYMSIFQLSVTSLVILTNPVQFTEGQQVELLEVHHEETK